MTTKSSFKLIRIVLPIVVLVIAVMAFLQFRSANLRAKESTLKSQLFTMRDAIDQYQADKGTCPESLAQLVAGKYLRAVPVDPFTNSATTWEFTKSGTGPKANCDVKTTSTAVARTGGRLAEW